MLQVCPTTAPGHVDKLPMSHLFILLLCISTVQQVYRAEIKVTALRKGKANAGVCHINHPSGRLSPGLSLCICQCEKYVKLGRKTVLKKV